MIAAPILVLIVNHRTPALAVQAAEAVVPELLARGDGHVLIVDNGSADGSAEEIGGAIAARGLGDCVSLLALADNGGFAAGNNAGLAEYRREAGRWPDFAWLLNPDTVARPGALGALLDALGRQPEAGIAGGRCLRPDGTLRPSAFRFPSPLGEFTAALDIGALRRRFARHDILAPVGDAPRRVDWVSGAHLLIRGALFDRIGLLDEGYFLYFEETDYCARAAKAGFEIWHVPGSEVVHIGGASTGLAEAGSSSPGSPYWFASRARFLLRHRGLAATHLANLLWLLATPPGRAWTWLRGRPRRDPPRLWRDFLMTYYGPGGLMYRARQIAR